MIFSWWTAILMALGLVPKAVEVGTDAAEDKRAASDLATSAGNVAEADRIAAEAGVAGPDEPTPPATPAARRPS